ncbi:unnamed protein product [Withania somnifera]
MGINAASVLNHIINGERTTPHSSKGSGLITTIINHLRLGRLGKAVSVLFSAPVPFRFPLYAHLFRICASKKAIVEVRKVESHLVGFAPTPPVFLLNRAIEAYGKCGCLFDARELFDEMPKRDGGSWNDMVTAYSQNGYSSKALGVFSDLHKSGFFAVEVTFAGVLASCASKLARPNAVTWNVIVRRYLEMGNGKESLFLEFREGIKIHGLIFKINYEEDEVVSCSLIDVYAKCEDLVCARTIFDLLSRKNLIHWTSIVSWNAMLAGYAHNSQWDEAMDLIILMCNNTRDIDRVTLNLILNVSGFQMLNWGSRLMNTCIGMVSTLTCMLQMRFFICMGNGNLIKARAWFSEMIHFQDMISWNALLCSYERHRTSEEALVIFREMLGGVTPSKFTFATLLAVCANIFAREQGKQIHGFMIRNLICMPNVNVFIGTPLKDVVLWNSLLLGCYYNKQSEALLKLFELIEDGVKPVSATFLDVMLACISQGCVKLGVQYFNSLSHDYFIIPQLEHYESMIKLYGLDGFFDELEDFVKKMPFQPTDPMLTIVFGSSKENNNTRKENGLSDILIF